MSLNKQSVSTSYIKLSPFLISEKYNYVFTYIAQNSAEGMCVFSGLGPCVQHYITF